MRYINALNLPTEANSIAVLLLNILVQCYFQKSNKDKIQ